MTVYYKLDHSEPGYLSQMLPRADGAWVKRADYDADLAAARTEIERLNNALIEAANQISDLASRLGQAEGRLDASELVGIVEGWKARAEKAEAERDSQEADFAKSIAIEVASRLKAEAERDEALAQVKHMEGFDHCTCGPCPIHQDAALEAYGREKVREGMKHMLNRLQHEGQINPSLTYADAIDWAEYVLDEMEKEAG